MSNPVIQKGNLTYVWTINASEKSLTIDGAGITLTFFDLASVPCGYKTYKNAIIGRPKGEEDYSGEEKREYAELCGRDYRTTAQNERSGTVGIYVLKP